MSGFDPDLLIAQLRPFAGRPRTWIAFSGGLDSSVLLAAAASVRAQLPGELRAVHVDHGLHPDSADWVGFCHARCASLGLPLDVRRLALSPRRGDSLEALAREARYRAMADLLGSGEPLLTAHNQDDQAETLLLALLRGSGVRGLSAMPVLAPLGAGYLLRPLLTVDRAALDAYARARGLAWIDDPSNASSAFDRNYLRHQVMPLLRARWPAVAATFSRSAQHCAEAALLVDEFATQTQAGLAGAHPGTLSVPGLLGLAGPLRKAVIRRWLIAQGFTAPDGQRLRGISTEVLSAGPDADPLVAWPGCEVRRYRQDLFALAPLPDRPSISTDLVWAMRAGQDALELPSPLGRLSWRDEARMDRVEPALLRVGFGVAAGTCRPAPAGASRELKKLYQDAGVPPWLRGYVPLVFRGDRLIAVAGVSACCQPDGVGAAPAGPRWSGHPWESFGIFR